MLHLNKENALDPNGFTIGFYQECWETIKDDLLRVFLKFHTNGITNQSTNATFITLVPKRVKQVGSHITNPSVWLPICTKS